MHGHGLEEILRAYGVQFDSASLGAALQDPEHGPTLVQWAADRLGPDTLLTKDELATYTSLEEGGQVDKLASGDLASVLMLSDRDIDEAIDELNRSTTAITKHTETLKQQHDALSRLVQTNAKNANDRSALESRQLSKWTSERSSLTSAVDDLSQRLDFRVAEFEQQSGPQGNGLHGAIDQLLDSDDKLLSSLQKLGGELETEDPEEEESVEKLRDICARLIKFTVETIRTRLDRIFLESLYAARKSSRNASTSTSADDVTTLQEELESLYSEILPVAQMSVEQQYLEPALKSLSEKNGQNVTRSVEAVAYIDECLDYMLDHMSRLSSRIEEFQSHQTTTAAIINTAKAELAVKVDQPAPKPDPSTFASPARRRRSSGAGGKSPVRLRNRRRSSGHLDEIGGPPLEMLLEHLALSLTPEEPLVPFTPGPNAPHAPAPMSIPTTTAQVHPEHVQLAAVALVERLEKAGDVARSVQDAVENGVAAHVAASRSAVQILRDEVLDGSSFGEVRLMDRQIEGTIDFLKGEVEKMQHRTQEVEKGIKAVGDSGKGSELIEMWGRR